MNSVQQTKPSAKQFKDLSIGAILGRTLPGSDCGCGAGSDCQCGNQF